MGLNLNKDKADKIVGATDGTEIGNTGDSLHVKTTSPIQISPGPPIDIVHTVVSLLNGSSKDMDVDGSVTPVDFEWSPGAGETWYIDRASINLGAANDTDSDEFGGDTALTNGFDIIHKRDGTEHIISNVKDNRELTNTFDSDTTLGSTDSKWFKDAAGRYFHGNMLIDPNITLVGDDGDKFIVRIRDDLTSVNRVLFMDMRIHAWRENG